MRIEIKSSSLWPILSILISVFLIGACGAMETKDAKEDKATAKESLTIPIAGKAWMHKNLATIHFKDGSEIPFAGSKEAWRAAAKSQTPAYCYVNGDSANTKMYGLLYNWYAVNDARGLAPNGYHVASSEDWQSLCDSLGGTSLAGAQLKANYGWSINPDTVFHPFAAVGTGGRTDAGQGFSFERYGHWWGANEWDSLNGGSIILNGLSTSVMIGANKKGSGFAVRCIAN